MLNSSWFRAQYSSYVLRTFSKTTHEIWQITKKNDFFLTFPVNQITIPLRTMYKRSNNVRDVNNAKVPAAQQHLLCAINCDGKRFHWPYIFVFPRNNIATARGNISLFAPVNMFRKNEGEKREVRKTDSNWQIYHGIYLKRQTFLKRLSWYRSRMSIKLIKYLQRMSLVLQKQNNLR